MKETVLHYTRGENNYQYRVFPKVFSNLVRRKIKSEHLEYNEAIIAVLEELIVSITCVDSYSFEYLDEEGKQHIISQVTK